MHRTLIRTVAGLVATGLLGGCGSSNGSSTTAATASQHSTGQHAAASGKTVTVKLAGSETGRRGNLKTLARLPRARRSSARAAVSGFSGTTLPAKLQSYASDIVGLWTYESQHAQPPVQLPPATLNIIDQTPAACGAQRVSSGDPPKYCPSDASIALPVQYLTSQIAPLGDAAVLLVVSDLYGYHAENALGLLGGRLSNSQLEQLDACFSGIYFNYAGSHFDPGDEEAVNALLAKKALAGGSAGGGATAAQLIAAFNKGSIGNGRYTSCLPTGSG